MKKPLAIAALLMALSTSAFAEDPSPPPDTDPPRRQAKPNPDPFHQPKDSPAQDEPAPEEDDLPVKEELEDTEARVLPIMQAEA